MLGGGLALVGAVLIAEEIPIVTTAGFMLIPVVVAIGFGMLTAYCFAFPAIGRALSVEPASLFRGTTGKVAGSPKAWWLAALVCAALICSMLLVVIPDIAFGLGFVC